MELERKKRKVERSGAGKKEEEKRKGERSVAGKKEDESGKEWS